MKFEGLKSCEIFRQNVRSMKLHNGTWTKHIVINFNNTWFVCYYYFINDPYLDVFKEFMK